LTQKQSRVFLIDNFESEDSISRWDGPFSLVTDNASQGNACAKVFSEHRRSGLMVLKDVPRDWSGYEYLKFDVYNPSDSILIGGFNLWDCSAGDQFNLTGVGQGYENGHKVIFIPGMTHVQVKLTDVWVDAGNRRMEMDNIVHFSIYLPSAFSPMYLDNVRLVEGEESIQTASKTSPDDVIVNVDGRWITTDLVGPKETILIDPATDKLRIRAEIAFHNLQQKVDAAKAMGIPCLYQEISLLTGQIGLYVRPVLPWYKDQAKIRELYQYVYNSCRKAIDEINGFFALRTDAILRTVPPHIKFRDVSIKDGLFKNKADKPVLVLSVHGSDTALITERASDRLYDFAAPINYTSETFSVGGGSRYNIETSPVYEAFHQHPDTHRVGWDGWCGHLIKDVWAMGGKKENVVICLESENTKKAIRQYIEEHAHEWIDNPDYLFNNMAYELTYICYCDTSQNMFREWLKQLHGSIEEVNRVWGTNYTDFDEIEAPRCQDATPLPDTNRACWYDWAVFNQERFTRHLEWVKQQIQQIAPNTPVTCGGITSMFSGSNATSGIDEEKIIRRVDDVILNEAGNKLIYTDLQFSLGEKSKPLSDPEHAGSVWELIPHFVRGNHVIGYYYWGTTLGPEFPGLWNRSLPHSWSISLEEVAEFLRTCLDVRRLSSEIAAFADTESRVKILYSHTNLIQLPRELVRAFITPYLRELRQVWESSRYLNSRALFITETQINEGKLHKNKVLLVPACRHLPEKVIANILEFVEEGGYAVVTPESFAADQYNRRIDFLDRLGITVDEVIMPKAVAGQLEQGYDQNLLRSVRFEDIPNRTITTLPEDLFSDESLKFQGSGLVQRWSLSEDIKVLATFDDGSAAIACKNVGEGKIYFLAQPLETKDYHKLFELVTKAAGIEGSVKVVNADNQSVYGVESLSVPFENDWLLYVYNNTGTDQELTIQSGFKPAGVRELRSWQWLKGLDFTIPANRSYILRLMRELPREVLPIDPHN
jgi:hypothetical protein